MRLLDVKRIYRKHNICLDIPKSALSELFEKLEPSSYNFYDRDSCYFLTHYIFFITDFGRYNFSYDGNQAVESCFRVGIYAFACDDLDLLSEVCMALFFLNANPPNRWLDYIGEQQKYFSIGTGNLPADSDCADYHRFLVSNWTLLQKFPDRKLLIRRDPVGSTITYSYNERNELLELENIAFHLLCSNGGSTADKAPNVRSALQSGAFPRAGVLLQEFPDHSWLPEPLR